VPIFFRAHGAARKRQVSAFILGAPRLALPGQRFLKVSQAADAAYIIGLDILMVFFHRN
jgi:hypothetical protein